MVWKVPLADIDIGPEEIAEVQAVLQGRWLTMGPITKAFEDEFARFLGVRHAIAVTNGTAALHLACLASGLKLLDEVIVPSLTFVATASVVRYVGATPIFADIVSKNDLTISADAIHQVLTDRTRGIIVMHYGGNACDMTRILSIARERNLTVIEDAAHCPGSVLDGKKLGTWGDVGCFSFFSNKNLVTGEGGMVVTDDDTIAKKLRLLRSHGMTTLTWDRHAGHAWSYDVVDLGYNYRLDEIRAAIGKIQLRKLARNNEKRLFLTDLYRELIQQIAPEIAIPFVNHRGSSACHIFPILLPNSELRTAFMESMKSKGIQTSIHYPPIHKFEYYSNTEDGGGSWSLPVTEEVADREVTLPLYASMDRETVETVVHAVREALHISLEGAR